MNEFSVNSGSGSIDCHAGVVNRGAPCSPASVVSCIPLAYARGSVPVLSRDREGAVVNSNTNRWRAAILMLLPLAAVAAFLAARAPAAEIPAFRDLFNGKDLTGWVNVNTAKDTWTVENGMLVCSGRPTGVMRTNRQYENFVLHVEWMHTEPGGNSGMFLWSGPEANPGSPFPDGIEVQMLELDWPKLNTRNGVTPPDAYVHGELFGVGKLKIVPDNPRNVRSMSIENRCKGRGEWNTYDVVAIDGVMKLSVNGKFVNGISKATQKKGYICVESEGAKIFFRNIRILELPPGVTSPEQSAPEAK